jgi:hypothetical protein
VFRTILSGLGIVNVFLVFLGCQGISPDLLDKEKTYRRTLQFEVDGSEADGIKVLAKRSQYSFRFYLPEKPNYIELTSCHRDELLFDPGKRLDYVYKPSPGIEDQPACLLEVAAFDEKGKNHWALIDFSLGEKLSAKINCNGKSYTSPGVTICQSKAGLIQTIEFEKPVKAIGPDRCPKMMKTHEGFFEYLIAKGKCLYLFSDGKDEHRLTTLGYDGNLYDH